MRIRAVLLFPLLMLLPVSMAFTQSNDVIDEILDEAGLSYRNAAYLVLTASGAVDESVAPERAVTDAAAAWGFEEKGAGEPVTLGEFSYMIMTSLGLSGGIMYRIMPGPRYAARELAFLGFVTGRASPRRIVAGDEALGMLGKVVEWKEAAK